jgi:hypothetical protein
MSRKYLRRVRALGALRNVELAPEEPARLIAKIPNNSCATVANKKPREPEVAGVQHAPLEAGLRGQ